MADEYTETKRVYYRDYECAHCLEISTSSDGPPSRCRVCHVVICEKCGTSLKGDVPFICHGCGEVFPEAHAHFAATDSYGCCYMEREWCKRNKGNYATGNYGIATGVADDNRGRCWVTKEIMKDGQLSSKNIRELTPEERDRYLNRHKHEPDDYCI